MKTLRNIAAGSLGLALVFSSLTAMDAQAVERVPGQINGDRSSGCVVDWTARAMLDQNMDNIPVGLRKGPYSTSGFMETVHPDYGSKAILENHHWFNPVSDVQYWRIPVGAEFGILPGATLTVDLPDDMTNVRLISDLSTELKNATVDQFMERQTFGALARKLDWDIVPNATQTDAARNIWTLTFPNGLPEGHAAVVEFVGTGDRTKHYEATSHFRGLRETDDVVEQIGIERSRKAVSEADVALILIDPREGVNAKTQAILNSLPEGLKKIEIHNKADLTGEPVAVRSDGLAQTGVESVISLSAKTGAGLDLLKHALLQEVGWQGESESLFLARSRHLNALHEAEAELENAALCNNNQIELFAEHLRLAQNACSEITGEFTADDLLGVIFSRFCIGK